MNGPDRIIPIVDAAQRGVTAVRASSWGSLFDCSFRWEGEHLLGMRKPAGLRAQLGTAIHASTAAFDSARLPGASRITVDDAAGVFVKTLREPDRDIDYSQDDLTVNDAERIGLKLHTEYCFDVSPRFTFKSVEQKLEPLDIDCGNGEIVRLTGTMDRARVAITADGDVIPDVKTGSRVIENGEVSARRHVPQIGVYQLMYTATEGTPAVGGQILALLTSTKPRVAVSPVFDARPVLLGTEQQPGLIDLAARMFRAGLFPPNPLSTLCSPKYCARWTTCPYHL